MQSNGTWIPVCTLDFIDWTARTFSATSICMMAFPVGKCSFRLFKTWYWNRTLVTCSWKSRTWPCNIEIKLSFVSSLSMIFVHFFSSAISIFFHCSYLTFSSRMSERISGRDLYFSFIANSSGLLRLHLMFSYSLGLMPCFDVTDRDIYFYFNVWSGICNRGRSLYIPGFSWLQWW